MSASGSGNSHKEMSLCIANGLLKKAALVWGEGKVALSFGSFFCIL